MGPSAGQRSPRMEEHQKGAEADARHSRGRHPRGVLGRSRAVITVNDLRDRKGHLSLILQIESRHLGEGWRYKHK